MPAVFVDFQGAIKGLKTVASLRSKLNDEIARGKIEAAKAYEKLSSNAELITHGIAEGYLFLFQDLQSLCAYEKEPLIAIVKQRISEYEAKEQARIQAEAQRIANEQIERDRFNAAQKAKHEAAELAKAQAEAIEAIKHLDAEVAPIRDAQLDLVESIPADYEQYAAQSPSFEQAFDSVFSEPEPIADMSDFFAGKMAAYAEIANLFFECKNSGRNFEQEFSELYQRNKLPKKAA